MVDHATPNLPSRDFAATAQFYARLGFAESYRDASWMIMERDGITLEFFPYPELDPARSAFSCCLRLEDALGFFDFVIANGIAETEQGWPRAHRPKLEAWGGLVGALIDIDGTLLRLIQEEV